MHSRQPRPDTRATPSAATDIAQIERRVVKWWHPPLVLLVLGGLFLLGDRLGLRGELIELRDWIDALGVLGPIAFVALYVVLTVLGLPGSMFTAVAGVLFGSWLGIVTSMTASSVAAILSFLISRHLAFDYFEQRMAGNRHFQQLNHLAAEHGALVVLVVRLINLLPFALVNYGFGLTRVRFRTYVLWSIVGKIPGTVVLVVGVDAISEALLQQRVPWGPLAVVVVLAVALALVIRKTHHWLQACASQQVEAAAKQQQTDNEHAGDRQSIDGQSHEKVA